MKVLFTFRRSFMLMLACLAFWTTAWAQNVVTGNVVDNFGDPIPGASVVEKGTTNGIMTDIDGNFSLKMIDTKHKLAVSYVGMTTKELTPTPGKEMKVMLEENNAVLEDVVVLGYTSRARKDLTGSVGSINGTKLEAVPATSAAVALQGKISGVQVTTVDGQPGAEVNIRVRGGSSISQSNKPLYIVDGFIQSDINDIPPSDILSIDVLKDASLTAIYGARGSNGVVVVSTKAAQVGKTQLTINASMSLSHLSKKLDLMDTEQFVKYQYQWHACNGTRSDNAKFFKANFGNPYDIDMYTTLPTHDWQDEVLGDTPLSYSTNATMTGGSEKARFYASITQSEDCGIIMDTGVRRTNVNIKTDFEVSKNVSIKINPKFQYRRDVGAGAAHVGTGGLIDVLRYRPTNGLREYGYIDPAYADPDEEELFNYTNPKSDIKINAMNKHMYTFTNSLSLDWHPIKNLSFRSDLTLSKRWQTKRRFYGALTSEGQKSVHNGQPVAEITDNEYFSYSLTNTANYSLTVHDDHNLSFLLGQEITDSEQTSQTMINHLFPRSFSATDAWTNMEFGSSYEAKTTRSTAVRMASFFGQASYNYNHKYLLALTLRADGSTRFGPDNRWGYFPSVAGAWVMSEESFMDNVDWIDNLKMRLSYGVTGNNDTGDDAWRALYAVNSTGGPGFGEATTFGEKYYQNSSTKTMWNEDIRWETVYKRNLAFDITMLGGRLTVTPEFYWNKTDDCIYDSDLVALGYTKQKQNIGQLSTRGIELTINGDILRGKDYVLSGSFTMGWNKQKIDRLNGTDQVVWDQHDDWKSSYNDYCLRVGDEVGLIYGFVYDGLYQFDEFYFDPLNNYAAIPWGSSATDNGTSSNCRPRDDGYVTVINEVLNKSNSGIATMPGKPKFKDLNGDGRITEDDRTVIGNTNPRFQGGFGFNGQYKNWDFAMNFSYMFDFDINNATAYDLSSSIDNKNKFYNVLAKFDNCWQYNDIDGSLSGTKGDILYKLYYVDDCVNIYKKANEGRTLWNPTDVVNRVTQSYFIEDGSFVRCNDITIGYTIPKSLTFKAGITKARFYVSVSNPFIFTGYSGYDPEVDIQTGLTCGMDYNRYPRSRGYVFGTNITF
ncbi:MAG: TonB-dependent receptor [Bacteroidales bacterium]|nr:TonB-dependent receptor [Bacteroidales bacterium]